MAADDRPAPAQNDSCRPPPRPGEPLCFLLQKLIQLRLFDSTLDLASTRDFPKHGSWTRERELGALAICYVLNFLLGWYLEVWPGGAVARSRCAPAHPLHTSCWGRRQCDRTPGLARAVGAGELSADVPPPRGLHADAVRTKGAQN